MTENGKMIVGRLRSFLARGRTPKVSKVTDKDGYRRAALTGAWLDKHERESVLVASDSYAMVRVPIELDLGKGEKVPVGWVPPEALRAIEALKKGESFKIDEGQVRIGRVTFDRQMPEDTSFPDWKKLWTEQAPEPYDRLLFAFNAQFLKNIADALGTQDLLVEVNMAEVQKHPDGDFKTYLRPLRVMPPSAVAGGDVREGLLMPVKVNP